MDTSGWNMYVFRDGRRLLPGRELVDALRNAIEQAESTNCECVINALVAAGELGCALADTNCPDSVLVDEITNEIAEVLVAVSADEGARLDTRRLTSKLSEVTVPATVRISVQEGFAYYALHPLKFAKVVERLALKERVAVVGIRSVGLTLSAVTLAALRKRGHDAQRITVRPEGHPYDRHVELDDWQRQWVADRKNATFLVVDEGPGLSGSSFISTGEALMRAGVAAEDIVLVGTRIPDVLGLRTPDAAERWTRYRSAATEPEPMLPEGADVPLGGGAWRQELLGDSGLWPGSWTQLERLKYVSQDRSRFYRFEGYGHYGAEHAGRARLVVASGLGPRYVDNVGGFGCYDYVDGKPLDASDATVEVLDRIAAYCAFRGREFPQVTDQPSELEQMLRFNWKNEFGAELEREVSLPMGRMLVTDSRMMPRKWLRTSGGELLKVDSTSHGDDHFFPGPCDIAWDLAGTIVEWGLSEAAAEHFLSAYRHCSGDDASARIGSYLLAYASFRFAYSRLAARAMGGTEEEPRLVREYQTYRQQALEIHGQYFSSKPTDQQSKTVVAPLGGTTARSAA